MIETTQPLQVDGTYNILKYGDSRLHTVAEEVTDFDNGEVQTIVARMFRTMAKYDKSVGLAATQCDVHKRIITIDTKRFDTVGAVYQFKQALINPRITECGEYKLSMESCLSIPGERENVSRCSKIRVQYQNELGEPQEIEAINFLAYIIQHEVDHLKGLTMIDHATSQRRKKFEKQWFKENYSDLLTQ